MQGQVEAAVYRQFLLGYLISALKDVQLIELCPPRLLG